MTDVEVKKPAKKGKRPAIPGMDNLVAIANFLKRMLKWVERATAKETETGIKTEMTLSDMLNKELENAVSAEEEAYSEALNAQGDDAKHAAIMYIVNARKDALRGTKKPKGVDDEIDLEEFETEEDEHNADLKQPRDLKDARKKGWLETTFDQLCAEYEKQPSKERREKILGLIAQLEINRRVRFFYDLQKLRIGANNRRDIYAREFGIKDIFIDHAGGQLERLERQNEKMVDRILLRSPDNGFYSYLLDTYRGVGTMMAGCIISEISAPERFENVSKLWSYAGLSVEGNDPETGTGGHAQYRARGEKANWNHFLRTKLLGVLATCMVKAQMPYLTGFAGKYTKENAPSPDMIGMPKPHPKDPDKCRNAKVLQDYKMRLLTEDRIVPENDRVYTPSGKEIFKYRSDKFIDVYDRSGNPIGKVIPNRIKRKSKAHINKMAVRYMIKMFLCDILVEWYRYKGLPLPTTYYEKKLSGGIPHSGLAVKPIQSRVVITPKLA